MSQISLIIGSLTAIIAVKVSYIEQMHIKKCIL